MRISAPQLSFHGEDRQAADPGDTGWFVSATDVDQDKLPWAVSGVKITPAQAMVIAAAFDAALSEKLGRQTKQFTNEAAAQNRYAAEAAKIAAETAEQSSDEASA